MPADEATAPEAHAPTPPEAAAAAIAPATRKRPRPGERREQILQALAAMLEQPGSERITTAALAARLHVSEAALYRHFASKAQMFEALIDFIETSVFGLLARLREHEAPGPVQAAHMLTVLLQFGERNPGMARVMVGDALVLEHERLRQRMNQLFDKVEAALRQSLRDGALDAAQTPAADAAAPSADAAIAAATLSAFAVGRLQRFVRSGFRRLPTEQLAACLRQML